MRMHRLDSIAAFAVVLCVVLAPGPALGEWAELSWDDCDLGDWGTPFVTGFAGDMVAVAFEAPEWARFVTGARFYIHNDLFTFPGDPEQPTSQPFLVRVWRSSGALNDPPGHPAAAGISTTVCSPYPHYMPEDTWVDVELCVPLHLEGAPPGEPRVFFVGVEWQHRLNRCIGRDTGGAPHMTSWTNRTGVSWELRTEDDVMVRAIVSDQASVAAELESWARVKALFME
jgi:hypothetical protein